MKRYNFSSIAFLFIFSAVFSFGGIAHAANISVVFEQEPLFSEGDIKPGDTVSRTVTVTNTSGEEQDVYVKAENGFSTGNLATTLFLTVANGSTFISALPISDFVDGVPRALTPNLADGASVTYTFSVAFPTTAGNEYQLGTAGFDFCVGFSGGESSCVSDGGGEGDDDDPVPTITSGGGGGGGGGGPVTLTILDTFNEDAQNITLGGDVTIVWDTNLPATSKVVYGLQSGGPYSLNLFAPNFGYPATTPEELFNTYDHSLPLSGLIPGETYVYRVASRQNPADVFTVSPEFVFTIPIAGTSFFSLGPVEGGDEGGGGSNSDGTGGEAPQGGGTPLSEGGDEEVPQEDGGVVEEEGNPQAAAALFGLPDFLNNLFSFDECSTAWMVTLVTLIAYLIATWWGRDFVEAREPVSRTFTRITAFALLGALSALFIWYFDENPYEMYPLLVMAVLMAGSALLDFFTVDVTLPYTRLFRTLLIFISGMIAATIIAAMLLAWCYIWPLVLVAITLLVRLVHLFTSHRNSR